MLPLSEAPLPPDWTENRIHIARTSASERTIKRILDGARRQLIPCSSLGPFISRVCVKLSLSRLGSHAAPARLGVDRQYAFVCANPPASPLHRVPNYGLRSTWLTTTGTRTRTTNTPPPGSRCLFFVHSPFPDPPFPHSPFPITHSPFYQVFLFSLHHARPVDWTVDPPRHLPAGPPPTRRSSSHSLLARFLLIADPASLPQSPKTPVPASSPRRSTHRNPLDTARRDATATGHRPEAFLSQPTRPPPEWVFHRRSQILHRRLEPQLSSRSLRFSSIPSPTHRPSHRPILRRANDAVSPHSTLSPSVLSCLP